VKPEKEKKSTKLRMPQHFFEDSCVLLPSDVPSLVRHELNYISGQTDGSALLSAAVFPRLELASRAALAPL